MVVGFNEVTQFPHLPGLLQRHGYGYDTSANAAMKERMENNPSFWQSAPPYIQSAENFVYVKEGR